MDTHQIKQSMDALGKKLVTLGDEFIKWKDEVATQKVLVKMFGETSPSSNPHLSILRFAFFAHTTHGFDLLLCQIYIIIETLQE